MSYTVDAVAKAINLLFLVAEQPGLGVTELAKQAGMTKARSYRLLDTIEKSGLVRRHGNVAVYSMSYMALFLGAAAQEQIALVRMSKKHLGEIGLQFDEPVSVRVRDGLESVCIALWDSNQSIRVHTKIGTRRPLYVGASGKLLTAYAAPDVVQAVLDAKKERFTSETLVDRDLLEKQFDEIRSQEASISNGERVLNIVAIAVPVRDASGHVVAALSVTVPKSRSSTALRRELLSALKTSAVALSKELGYTGMQSAG